MLSTPRRSSFSISHLQARAIFKMNFLLPVRVLLAICVATSEITIETSILFGQRIYGIILRSQIAVTMHIQNTAIITFIAWLRNTSKALPVPVPLYSRMALLAMPYGHMALWFQVIPQRKLSSANWSPVETADTTTSTFPGNPLHYVNYNKSLLRL